MMAGQRVAPVDEELRRAIEHVRRADDFREFRCEGGHV